MTAGIIAALCITLTSLTHARQTTGWQLALLIIFSLLNGALAFLYKYVDETPQRFLRPVAGAPAHAHRLTPRWLPGKAILQCPICGSGWKVGKHPLRWLVFVLMIPALGGFLAYSQSWDIPLIPRAFMSPVIFLLLFGALYLYSFIVYVWLRRQADPSPYKGAVIWEKESA